MEPSIAKPKAVVGVNNTCCGEHLSAPHTVGPFLKYWGLERLPGSDKQGPAPANVPVKAGPGPAAEQREQSASASPAGRFTSYLGPKSQQLHGRPAIWVGSVLVVTQVGGTGLRRHSADDQQFICGSSSPVRYGHRQGFFTQPSGASHASCPTGVCRTVCSTPHGSHLNSRLAFPAGLVQADMQAVVLQLQVGQGLAAPSGAC